MNDGLVAVSGAAGFIGSAVVRELLGAGRQVRALLEPGVTNRNLDGLVVDRVVVDICDHEGMTRALDGCAAYYHLAAIYQVWVPDPEPVYRVNVEGTATCLLAAQRAGVARIVYTSSIAAVGLREDGAPSDETVPFNLYDIANDYLLTKHLAERIALRFAEGGLPVTIVNPAFPFGQRDSAPTPTGGIILAVLRGKVPVITPGGFCAIDVGDVAKAHVAAEIAGRVGERYILGNHNVSFRDFVELVCRTAGRRPPRIRVPAQVGEIAAAGFELWANHVSHRPPRATLKSARYVQRRPFFDCTKARRELAMPCTPLAESVERAIAWFRRHDMV
ncbi:MAG: SDR family oxidoreductase [Deltaproteobacteria bacterium]|nr:SDR family oxidoreductase [Deltaproteobacteria bacterium]